MLAWSRGHSPHVNVRGTWTFWVALSHSPQAKISSWIACPSLQKTRAPAPPRLALKANPPSVRTRTSYVRSWGPAFIYVMPAFRESDSAVYKFFNTWRIRKVLHHRGLPKPARPFWHVCEISDLSSSPHSSSPPTSLPLSQRNFPASFWNSEYHSLPSSEVASAASSLASIAGQSAHSHDLYPSGRKPLGCKGDNRAQAQVCWSSGPISVTSRSLSQCRNKHGGPVAKLHGCRRVWTCRVLFRWSCRSGCWTSQPGATVHSSSYITCLNVLMS